MAKAKKKQARKRYTAEQRTKILAAANSEKLTAAGVEKRFGVKPVTYYSWRKAAKGTRPADVRARRGRRPKTDGLPGAVRAEVQRRVRELLPQIVREETNRYLTEVLGK